MTWNAESEGEQIEGAGASGGPPRRLSWPARCYLWATQRLYHELAWAYDPISWLVSLGRWSRWRRMALAHVTAEPVLEIGFGTGDLLIEMVQRGLQVCGLELSPAMQRITARKMRRRGVWAPRLRADAQAMPFAGASLGAIVATFPAAYILAPTTWQEAARVLRPPDPAAGTPGGRLIVAGLLVEAGGTLLRRVAQFTHGGLPERTVAQLQRLAEANGFGLTVVREQTRWLRSPVLVLERTEPREGSEAPASDTPRGRAAGPLRREVVDT